jgi:hypothetical protein
MFSRNSKCANRRPTVCPARRPSPKHERHQPTEYFVWYTIYEGFLTCQPESDQGFGVATTQQGGATERAVIACGNVFESCVRAVGMIYLWLLWPPATPPEGLYSLKLSADLSVVSHAILRAADPTHQKPLGK